ncbi:putative chromatin regulator PHD family [Helianthus annuus]|nr:putative chromatin regulator PHD family [Helianthus annuus]
MLKYLPKSPYLKGSCSCDVCGTKCNPTNELYHCNICGYDAHVTCVNLPETIRREDHEHTLSLLHVNPHPNYECDVCRGAIAQNHCMYHCMSGCDYSIHIKCVSRKVSEKAPVNEITFDNFEMRPSYWAILIIIMVAIVIIIMDNNDYFCNRCYRNG